MNFCTVLYFHLYLKDTSFLFLNIIFLPSFGRHSNDRDRKHGKIKQMFICADDLLNKVSALKKNNCGFFSFLYK